VLKKFAKMAVISCLILALAGGGSLQAESDFLNLVQRGSYSEIRQALEEGADVNQQNEAGKTPLMLAATKNSDARVIDLLLDYGARMERRDNRGRTALYHAVRENPRTSVTRRLIARGAAINITTDEGYTPLLRAAASSSREKVELLLGSGARPDQRSPEGRTALMILLEGDPSPFLLRRILNAGASVRISDNSGNTPLHFAAKNSKNVDIISLLLERSANLEARNNLGQTPLLLAAAHNGEVEIMTHLLKEGADIEAVDREKKGVLHQAVTGPSAREKVARLAARTELDIDQTDRDGNTALHLALQERRPDYDLIAELLDAGSDPDMANNRGNTPLMILAEKSDRAGLFSLLLEAGADADRAGRLGITPLMLAAENTASEEVIFTLLEAGAEVVREDNRGRKVVDYLEGNRDLLNTDAYWELQYMEPAERQLDKLDIKSNRQATLRGLAVPSLGHAYADSWWPRGALFLAGEAAALGMALTRDESSDALPFYIAFGVLKALEIFDVNRRVDDFNEMAEDYNMRVEEFNRRYQD